MKYEEIDAMNVLKLGVGLSCAAFWLASPLYAETVVTGFLGAVAAGDQSVDKPGAVADNELVETGEDGRASVFSQNVLVELCSNVSLAVREEGDRQIVRVDSGAVRLLVEPVVSGRAPMQIHTPVAIATVLGTEVFVTVDSESGATTFTAVDHPVRIDTPDGGTITLHGGEQTTVLPNQSASAARRLGSNSLAQLGSCLADFQGAIRTLALNKVRSAQAPQAFDQVAVAEVLPPLPAPPAAPPAAPPPVVSPEEGTDLAEQSNPTVELPYIPSDVDPSSTPTHRSLPGCSSPPCEQGFR
jgi:hypothetical protein